MQISKHARERFEERIKWKVKEYNYNVENFPKIWLSQNSNISKKQSQEDGKWS